MFSKAIFPIVAGLFATLLVGCASTEFPDVGTNAAWYERTDAHAFLRHEERRRGPALFIGLYDPNAKDHVVIPGVSRRDPLVSAYQTCTVGAYSKTGSAEKRRYVQAVTNFARRYNPLILALLREHPESRIQEHPPSAATR